MKFKTFAKDEYPLKIKDIQNMNIWLDEDTNTKERLINFEGETSLSLSKIDELIKTLKRIKKIK